MQSFAIMAKFDSFGMFINFLLSNHPNTDTDPYDFYGIFYGLFYGMGYFRVGLLLKRLESTGFWNFLIFLQIFIER